MTILKVSPLSGPLHVGAQTLTVTIFQDDENGEAWMLQVSAPDGRRTTYGDGFATEAAALAELRADIEAYGTRILFGGRPRVMVNPIPGRVVRYRCSED